MKYDFDKINERRNTKSMKWDVADNELPMWVADMDFTTAPEITEALKERAKSGIFGYQIIPNQWYQVMANWWKEQHGFQMNPDWFVFCTGVLPAITCAVKRITNVGDNVVIQTPVYDMFFHSVENQGRHVLESPLIFNGIEYEMDFDDLEKRLAHPLTTMMILCNPHNPVGRLWTSEELEKVGSLCEKYHVTVVSDEIHCDITEPGEEYIPYASVSQVCRNHSITCIAATKAFNMAGLQTAAVSIPNEGLRNIMERGLNSDEVAEPNYFAIDAVIAAFTNGKEWLVQLRQYISDNRKMATEYIKKELPELTVVKQKATYLLWIDCKKITHDTMSLCEHIRKTTGLFITEGGQYRGDGAGFIRINIACPKSQVEEGLRRLKEGVSSYFSSTY